jgi:hypothetical protein
MLLPLVMLTFWLLAVGEEAVQRLVVVEPEDT